MKILPHKLTDRYIGVVSGAPLDKGIMSTRHKKGDTAVMVENTLVNRILLGLDPVVETREVVLRHSAQLKDYQKVDVEKMLSIKHILNANPMGLGKTVEAIVAMRELDIQNALIIVPKSIIHQWAKQLEYWWPATKGKIYENPQKLVPNGFNIINYEKMLNTNIFMSAKSVRWNVLLLDEGHRIKNRDSKRTKLIKQLPAERRWVLTGTPILNKPDDLWSILNFLDISYSGASYWAFVERFCKVREGFFGKEIEGLTHDEKNVALLNKVLNLVAIRNSEVVVAKGKQISVVKLEMETKQRRLYNNVKKLVFDELPDTLTVPNGAVLTLRLQQVTSNPGLFDKCDIPMNGVKFEWIKELLEDNPDKKVVVFTKFAETAKALRECLYRAGICSELFIGSMEQIEKVDAIDAFINNPGARCIIGTIGAMGQGVDELQLASSTMVFIDRDWSPELLRQAEDRLNRMGQEFPVNIYYLECDNTFDQHVGRININKLSDIKKALQD